MCRQYPIDLVYLWCDVAEPVFRAKRAACAAKFGISLGDSVNGDGRFRNNDELRFSLRSAERYAPWLRRIFVCMDDDQAPPPWLDLENPRLRIVRQSEFVPGEFLPTFNSMTVEHFLWRIPGLSERFLYANDDMMFGRPLSPDFFFAGDGRPFCRFIHPMPPTDKAPSAYRKWVENGADLFRTRHASPCADAAASLERWPHHNIDACVKSDLERIYRLYRDAITPTLVNPFRTDDSIHRNLYSHEGIQSFGWHYRQLDGVNPETAIMPSFWSLATAVNSRSLPALFCFNDSEWRSDYERRHGMRLISELLLPGKSGFEVRAADDVADGGAETRRAAVRRHLERYCARNGRDNFSAAARKVLERLKREPRPSPEHPLVSAIVSVRNAERTLNDCMAGVFSEQGTPDMEVVCVDDGSVDDSVELLESWAKEAPCLRIVERAGTGPDAARKAGLAAARGEYRFFLSASDRLARGNVLRKTREHVERMVREAAFAREVVLDIGRPDIRPAFEERNVPVALSTDGNYLPYLDVVLRSIVANSQKGNLDILILHDGIGADARHGFTDRFKDVGNLSVRFVDVGDAVEATHFDTYRQVPGGHLTTATLFRTFLPRLLPAYDKIVYLDVDVCVRGDLADLFHADLGDCLLAGVHDIGVETYFLNRPDYLEHAALYGFSAWDGYVNSGVVVMNLAAFRAEDALSRRIMAAAIGSERYLCDQDALNFLCAGRIRPLDAGWNALTTPPCPESWAKITNGLPKIYHYAAKAKPWSHPEIAFADRWWSHVPLEFGAELWRKAFGDKAQVSIGEGVAASVVIPVFNAEAGLAHTLFSYSAQTLENAEVICVDDGSTDGSREICERFATFDPRIKVVSQPHRGAAAACNRGIAEARGRWIFFGGADGFCRPEMLAEMVSAGERDEADVVVAGWRVVDESTGFVSERRLPAGWIGADCTADCLDGGANLFLDANPAVWNKLFKADFVRSNGLEHRPNRHAGSAFFSCAALARAGRTSFISLSGYYHKETVSGGGTDRTEREAETPSDWLSVFAEVKPLLEGGDGRLQAHLFGAAVMQLFRILFASRTGQGAAAAFDVLKNGVLKLAPPSTDADAVDLGPYRGLFDIVRSGGDLEAVFRAQCDLLAARNERERRLVAQRDARLAAQKKTVAERDKRLADLKRTIAERNASLKNARAEAKRQKKAAKALKSSLSYRVGLLLTWPLRKAWNAVRGS